MTTHEYDDNGRLVRTVATTESEWDTESYEMAAALADIEADQHTCGHPLSETTSWAADELNPHRTIFYTANAPVRCTACAVIAREQKKFADEGQLDDAQLWSAAVDRRLPTTE